MKHKIKTIPVPLTDSRLVIAMAQIEGPITSGKTAVFSDGRETLVWNSKAEIEKRTEKAAVILDFLGASHPEVKLVVFPEYCLPLVEPTIALLKAKSSQYGQLIIAGADHRRQSDGSQVHTQCAVFIPGGDVVWTSKRQLSQWEQGYVDSPAANSATPVFTWKVGNEYYRFVVYVSLDITLAVRSAPPEGGALLYVVPMCSPDNLTFRTYAATLATEPGERAVVLCNSIDNFSAGGSTIFKGGLPEPALELSDFREVLAVVELDCANLSATGTLRSGSEETFLYNLSYSAAGIAILPVDSPKDDQLPARAVINPALFAAFGKKMRMTFVEVQEYGSLNEREMEKEGFEAYSVLGHTDMVITHLHESAYRMIMDISQVIPWKLPTGLTVARADAGEMIDKFPYFEITHFYKVLGVPVGHDDQKAFQGQRSFPTAEDLKGLLALGEDWRRAPVDPAVREHFLEKRWILGVTPRQPGAIDAVMTIFLVHPDEIQKPLQDFEDSVLPALLEDEAITSIFGGTGTRLQIHYVLRLTSGVGQLFDLIDRVHKLATAKKIYIRTNTYVMVKQWSALSLAKSLPFAELSPKDENYRNLVILPKLTQELGESLLTKAEGDQMMYMGWYRSAESALNLLGRRQWLESKRGDIERKLARGLLERDFALLQEPHALLQARVEGAIRRMLKEAVAEAQFEELRAILQVPKGKTLETLTYSERLKMGIYLGKQGASSHEAVGEAAELLQKLSRTTVSVRNAMVHGDWDKISLVNYCEALNSYCEFLARWDAK